MATASYFTNRGLQLLASADFDAIDFRAMLIKNEVAAATGRDHNTLNQAITAGTEADCTGYSRKTLAGIAVTEDDSGDQVTVAFTSVSWGALGGASNCQIAQMVIYRYNASDSSAEIVAYVGAASGLPFTTNGSTVTSTTPTFTLTSTAT
jgi:hypothetical protein